MFGELIRVQGLCESDGISFSLDAHNLVRHENGPLMDIPQARAAPSSLISKKTPTITVMAAISPVSSLVIACVNRIDFCFTSIYYRANGDHVACMQFPFVLEDSVLHRRHARPSF